MKKIISLLLAVLLVAFLAVLYIGKKDYEHYNKMIEAQKDKYAKADGKFHEKVVAHDYIIEEIEPKVQQNANVLSKTFLFHKIDKTLDEMEKDFEDKMHKTMEQYEKDRTKEQIQKVSDTILGTVSDAVDGKVN